MSKTVQTKKMSGFRMVQFSNGHVDHWKSGHVRFSDPHCIRVSGFWMPAVLLFFLNHFSGYSSCNWSLGPRTCLLLFIRRKSCHGKNQSHVSCGKTGLEVVVFAKFSHQKFVFFFQNPPNYKDDFM